jgi:hypothetical protein
MTTAAIEALDRTIAFFTANPNAWIQVELGGIGRRLETGKARAVIYVHNLAQADCFCAIGRLAYELGEHRVDIAHDIVGDEILEPLGIGDTDHIWMVNDGAKSVDEVLPVLKDLRDRHAALHA